MPVYLETTALRKLTCYKCREPTYTSIFSIFELLSGITENDFETRKACLYRIKKQRIEIKGPMVDKLFMKLIGVTDDRKYTEFAYKMIKDTWDAALNANNYSCFKDTRLLVTDKNNKRTEILALSWLKNGMKIFQI